MHKFTCTVYIVMQHQLSTVYLHTRWFILTHSNSYYSITIHLSCLGVGAFHIGFSVHTAVCGYLLTHCLPLTCLYGPFRATCRCMETESLIVGNEMAFSIQYHFKECYLLLTICLNNDAYSCGGHRYILNQFT